MTAPGRWFVVANPVSGGGRARRYWPKLAAALARRGVAHDLASTRGPGDGARLVAEAVAGGHRRLLALGGDGSFNELVNGLFAAGAPPGHCLVAVAALGTGNDWARAMQVPDDPEKLAAFMARACRSNSTGGSTGIRPSASRAVGRSRSTPRPAAACRWTARPRAGRRSGSGCCLRRCARSIAAIQRNEPRIFASLSEPGHSRS